MELSVLNHRMQSKDEVRKESQGSDLAWIYYKYFKWLIGNGFQGLLVKIHWFMLW
jgi:hypothetical protein